MRATTITITVNHVPEWDPDGFLQSIDDALASDQLEFEDWMVDVWVDGESS